MDEYHYGWDLNITEGANNKALVATGQLVGINNSTLFHDTNDANDFLGYILEYDVEVDTIHAVFVSNVTIESHPSTFHMNINRFSIEDGDEVLSDFASGFSLTTDNGIRIAGDVGDSSNTFGALELYMEQVEEEEEEQYTMGILVKNDDMLFDVSGIIGSIFNESNVWNGYTIDLNGVSDSDALILSAEVVTSSTALELNLNRLHVHSDHNTSNATLLLDMNTSLVLLETPTGGVGLTYNLHKDSDHLASVDFTMDQVVNATDQYALGLLVGDATGPRVDFAGMFGYLFNPADDWMGYTVGMNGTLDADSIELATTVESTGTMLGLNLNRLYIFNEDNGTDVVLDINSALLIDDDNSGVQIVYVLTDNFKNSSIGFVEFYANEVENMRDRYTAGLYISDANGMVMDSTGVVGSLFNDTDDWKGLILDLNGTLDVDHIQLSGDVLFDDGADFQLNLNHLYVFNDDNGTDVVLDINSALLVDTATVNEDFLINFEYESVGNDFVVDRIVVSCYSSYIIICIYNRFYYIFYILFIFTCYLYIYIGRCFDSCNGCGINIHI